MGPHIGQPSVGTETGFLGPEEKHKEKKAPLGVDVRKHFIQNLVSIALTFGRSSKGM